MPRRSAACILTALALSVAPDARAAEAETSLPETVVPDLDSGRRNVLVFATGELVDGPRSRFTSEADLVSAIGRLGDLAYDDAKGGILVVPNGRAYLLSPEKPVAIAADEAGLEAVGDVSRGERAVPGVGLLVRQKDASVILRLVSRQDRGIRVRFLRKPGPRSAFSSEELEALWHTEPPEPPEPEVSRGAGALPALSEEARQGLSFEAGAAVTVEASGRPDGSPAEARRFAEALARAADVVFVAKAPPRLFFAGPHRSLGRGLARRLAGKRLEPMLAGSPGAGFLPIAPGSLSLLSTAKGTPVLLRVSKVGESEVELHWIVARRPDGVIEDTSFLDSSSARGVDRLSQDDLSRRLGDAIRSGDATLVAQLVSDGAELEAVSDVTGFTPLIEAAVRGDPALVALLLDSGSEVDGFSRDGWSALHAAARMGNYDVVRLLLERGADPLAATGDGATPLEVALSGRRVDPRIVTLLEAQGGGPTTLKAAVAAGDAGAVRRMLEANRTAWRSEEAPLMLRTAAENGDVDTLRALVEAGFDPSAAVPRQGTPLEAAARKDQVEAVRLLLEVQPDLEPDDLSGLLYGAVEANSAAVTAELLDRDVALEQLPGKPYDPMELAFRYGDTETVEAFEERGFEAPIWAAARLGDVAGIEAFGGTSIALNQARSPDGYTALGLAVESGGLPATEALLAAGADPNLLDDSFDARAPLHYAVQQGSAALVGVLLDAGASPNALTRSGRTPLVEAATLGRVDVVEMLLKRGADATLEYRGASILESTRNPEVRELLTQHGARQP